MPLINEYIHFILQYGGLALMALLLIACHNWILNRQELNPFKRSVIDLRLQKQWGLFWSLFLVLLTGTVGGMFLLVPSFDFLWPGILAVFITLISSFFLLLTFKASLSAMREGKLSLKFLINQNFLLTIYLMTCTELSFLYWLKEIKAYIQTPFLTFVVLYSVLVITIGIFLGHQKGESEQQPFNQGSSSDKEQSKNWRYQLIIILDPIIIVFLTGILLKVMWDIMLVVLPQLSVK